MPDPAVKTSPPVHFKSLKGPWHLKKPSNLKNLKQHKKLKNLKISKLKAMEKWVIYRVSYKGSVRPALLVWQIYSVVFDVKNWSRSFGQSDMSSN